jgi:RHS repeat-associated protein
MNKFFAIFLSFLPFVLALPANTRETSTIISRGPNGINVDTCYLLQRVYDPQNGRFLNADPIVQDTSNPQCYNRYSYCTNNPIRYVDPSGYAIYGPASQVDPVKETGGAGGGIGCSMKDIGKPTESTGIFEIGGGYTARAGTGQTSFNEGPTVFRYVSAQEANVAQKTGFIPNTDIAGKPKDVFVTPAKLSTAGEAENVLQI